MFCAICKVEWEYASIRCPDCGGRLQAASDWLLRCCEEAPDMPEIYLRDNIPESKAANVRTHYPIGDDELMLLIDATVFGSAKVGLAVGRRGIYWNTDWTTETRRKSLDWDAFIERDIELDGMTIRLGKGDNIDGAALGGDEKRRKLVKWLRTLQGRARQRDQ